MTNTITNGAGLVDLIRQHGFDTQLVGNQIVANDEYIAKDGTFQCKRAYLPLDRATILTWLGY